MRGRSRQVVLAGDLDMYEAPQLRRLLDEIDGPGVVDMRDVRYLDSAALSVLARVARRVGPRAVTLVVASPNIRKVLGLVCFDTLFRIVDARAHPTEYARAPDAERQPMKYLVFCTCGHGLDLHGAHGCDGEGGICRCRRDEYTALESAVDQARSHTWSRVSDEVIARTETGTAES